MQIQHGQSLISDIQNQNMMKDIFVYGDDFPRSLKEAKSDPQELCRLYRDLLQERVKDLKFSRRDDLPYLFSTVLKDRKLPLKEIFQKSTIQRRLIDSIITLYGEAGENQIQSPKCWNQTRKKTLQNYQLVMGKGEVLW